MELTLFDVLAFGAFIAVVVGVSLYASRREQSTEDYFLAGRQHPANQADMIAGLRAYPHSTQRRPKTLNSYVHTDSVRCAAA